MGTAPEIEIITMEGPVTVAHREVEGEWHATALEFDILGTGATRDAAFNELRGLVNDYLCEIINTPGRVRLENPAEGREWAVPDKEFYHLVAAVVRPPHARRRAYRRRYNIAAMRSLRNRIRTIDLVRAGV